MRRYSETTVMALRTDIAISIAAILMIVAVVGCDRSDLSGYRPLDKASGTKTVEKDVPTVEKHNPTSTDDATTAGDPEMPLASLVTVDEPLPVSALAPVNVVDGANVTALLKVTPNEVASSVVPTPIEKPSTEVGNPAASSSTSTEPRRIEVLIPEKTFRTDAASKSLRVSYDDLDLLKVINMEPVTVDAVDHMPEWLKELNGKRIKLRGYMYPPFVNEGIERFVLARDNQICCFGRDPKVYDLVQVDMKAGKTTNYIPATRPFDVIGRFRIEMVSSEGQLLGLYFLEDAEVIDR